MKPLYDKTVAAYDVARANAPYRAALLRATESALDDGALILGEVVEAFEARFAAFCGVRHCVGVGNGLDALTLALAALGVGPGDEVIVPAFTFVATWSAVSLLGARPVAVDVLEDGTIDSAGIAAAITRHTRAIVPVHLYGRLAEMDRILGIAAYFGLPVVEDAAQAHGARLGDRCAGGFGALAAFSFYPTKNLGALGDAGAVCTDDEELAERVRQLRNYGSVAKYRHDRVGRNSRLDRLQAAFLLAKLAGLEAANGRRRGIARRYCSALTGLAGLLLPESGDESMVWHQFVVRSERRCALQAQLAGLGVQTGVHYPTAPFDQPCYAGQYAGGRYPVARGLARSVLSLPMAEYLTPGEVAQVIGAVTEVLGGVSSPWLLAEERLQHV